MTTEIIAGIGVIVGAVIALPTNSRAVVIESVIGTLVRLGVLRPGENREGPYVEPEPEPDMVGSGKLDGLQEDPK